MLFIVSYSSNVIIKTLNFKIIQLRHIKIKMVIIITLKPNLRVNLGEGSDSRPRGPTLLTRVNIKIKVFLIIVL